MSPERSYVVEPVVSTDASGQEHIADFSVVSSSNRADPNEWKNDFVMDSEGQYHHMFEDVELEDEQYSPTSFDEDAYIEAIQEANPQLQDALAWAVEYLPEDVIEDYNNAIDSSDLHRLNEKVEWLLQQYAEREIYEQQIEDEDDEPSPIDELTEDEKDEMEIAIADLQEQVPQGEAYAEEWQEMVSMAEEAGDHTYAIVAAATAAFHSGQVTSEEAIGYCAQQCEIKELARVYKMLNQ